jgi:GT2 family glycosyltransferase
MKPVVTIAVLNWNGDRHIHRCLEHVFGQSYPNIEVMVIDNGSQDGSLERVKARHGKRCKYIENSENRGYAVGMNQGIESAAGEFIVPLNQDVCLHQDFVSECVRRILQDEKIGAIGGRVYSWIGDELTDVLRKGEGEKHFFRKRFQTYAGEWTETETWVLGAAGSFPFLRMRMLRDVRRVTGDYYDESFVTGWEDTDLWFRLQLRGWTCLFVPTAYGWHVGSGSTAGNATFFSKSLEYRTRILRNRLYTITKNLPPKVFFRLAPHLVATELAMIPYFMIRSPSSIVAFMFAWLDFISNSREAFRKRRLVQESAIVDSDYIQRFFVKF